MAFALCIPIFFILFSTTVSIVLSQSEGDLRLVKTATLSELSWKIRYFLVREVECLFYDVCLSTGKMEGKEKLITIYIAIYIYI